jgi:hypothetical protein
VTGFVSGSTAVGTVLTNKVSVSPTTDDSNPGNNNLTQSTTVVSPSGVDIHGQPHNAQAGQGIGLVKVSVVDAKGNTIPGSDTPVTLSIYSGPAGAILEGTTTVRAVNGVATFTNLALSEAGTYVLTATSGTLAADFSNPITISPAVVSGDVAVVEGQMYAQPSKPGIIVQKVTITNTSNGKLQGPSALVLAGLPSGVTLQNASGTYQGNPYIDVLGDKQSLAAGKEVTVTLSFLVTGLKNPYDFSYSTKALLGI